MAKPNDVEIKVGVNDADLWSFVKKAAPELGHIITKGGLVKGAIGTAFAFAAHEIGKAIDELQDLNHELIVASRRTGGNVEDLQGWTKQMKKFGGDTENVVKLLEKLELSKAKALEEGPLGKTRSAFQRLGISGEELASMSPSELFKKMQQGMQTGAGTMGHMVELSAIFGNRLVKDTKILNENLEEAQKKLKEMGGFNFISNEQSAQIELLRKQSKENSFGGSVKNAFITTESTSRFATAMVDLKAIVRLFSDSLRLETMGPRKAWEKFTDVFVEQHLAGMRDSGGLNSVERQAVQENLDKRAARRAELIGNIQSLAEEVKPKSQQISETQALVRLKEDELAAAKEGSTKYLEIAKDLLDAQKRLKDLTGDAGRPSFGSNPLLSIGGLAGVDFNYRLVAGTEQTARNTADILAAIERQQKAPASSPATTPLPDVGASTVSSLHPWTMTLNDNTR